MPSYIKISLVEPCEEDIANMSDTACGKHCLKCNKEVIDFTRMTDMELIDWMRKRPVAPLTVLNWTVISLCHRNRFPEAGPLSKY